MSVRSAKSFSSARSRLSAASSKKRSGVIKSSPGLGRRYGHALQRIGKFGEANLWRRIERENVAYEQSLFEKQGKFGSPQRGKEDEAVDEVEEAVGENATDEQQQGRTKRRRIDTDGGDFVTCSILSR